MYFFSALFLFFFLTLLGKGKSEPSTPKRSPSLFSLPSASPSPSHQSQPASSLSPSPSPSAASHISLSHPPSFLPASAASSSASPSISSSTTRLFASSSSTPLRPSVGVGMEDVVQPPRQAFMVCFFLSCAMLPGPSYGLMALILFFRCRFVMVYFGTLIMFIK